MKCIIKCSGTVGIFMLTFFITIPLLYAEISGLQVSGEIAVHVDYGKEAELCDKYETTIQISLLSDEDDILSQIEQLRTCLKNN